VVFVSKLRRKWE